jgi:hypothetical protein
VDCSTGKVWFSKNGTVQSGDPAAGTSPALTLSSVTTWAPGFGPVSNLNGYGMAGDINCGQRAFAYTPPTGFKALCTENLPTPSIARGDDYFAVNTRTGTGASASVTGLRFQPDLVWIKSRSATTDHALYDSSRGVQKRLESNTADDEVTSDDGVTAFNADGFTLGALAQVNTNAATYVNWAWKKGATPGFDVVTYTGTGSNRTINHSLGVAPEVIIVKARTTAGSDHGWPVYHKYGAADAETDYFLLNSGAVAADDATVWNDTAPTASVFSVGTAAAVNANNDTYVSYLFSAVPGFSKFGSYTGSTSADGPFVWLGFRPAFVMVRGWTINITGLMFDSARSPYNPASLQLYSSATDADTSSALFDFLSNGFKLRAAQTANTYVYLAFAESPFKYSNAR